MVRGGGGATNSMPLSDGNEGKHLGGGMMKIAIAVGLVALSLASPVFAQRMEPPNRGDARYPAERSAYEKAMCVYRGLTEAGKVFTPASAAMKPTPESQARAKLELEQWAAKSKAAVRICLTEKEVYDLGRYSFLEDMAFAEGTVCRLSKSPAARFERTPNNNDGDIVNGATKWEDIPDRGPLEAHPFFRGQSEAREQFRSIRDRGALCRAIVDEFGPTGVRIPGMVRNR